MSQLSQRLKRNFVDKEYAHAYVESFLNTSIASQIRVLRKQKKWTQKKLALKAGMEQSRISALEDVNYDQWSISTLKRLAEAFDVTLNVSFGKFTDKIEEIAHFNHESLAIPSRMDDLASLHQNESNNKASSSHLRLVYNADADTRVIDATKITNPIEIDREIQHESSQEAFA